MAYLKKLMKKSEKYLGQMFYNAGQEHKELERKGLELRNDKALAIQTLAEIKALRCKAEEEIEFCNEKREKFKKKAEKALKKAKEGKLEINIAESIAQQALALRKVYKERAKTISENIPVWEENIIRLENTISVLKEKISIQDKQLREAVANTEAGKILNNNLYTSGHQTRHEKIITELEKVQSEIVEDIELENLNKEFTDASEVDKFLKDQEIKDELENLKKNI